MRFRLPREIWTKRGRRGLNTFHVQQIHSWNAPTNTFVSFSKIILHILHAPKISAKVYKKGRIIKIISGKDLGRSLVQLLALR